MAGQAAGAMTPSEQPVAGAAAGRRWMDAGWTPWERILRGCPELPIDEDLAKTDKEIALRLFFRPLRGLPKMARLGGMRGGFMRVVGGPTVRL